MSERDSLRRLNHVERCSAIEQIVRHQLPRIKAESGITDPLFYNQQIKRALTGIGCQTATALSVWTPAPPTRSALQAGDSVTGTFMNYTDALEAAVTNAASPEDAYTALDGVVASASGLGAADEEVVAGLASMDASSAAYWYEQAEEGNVGGGGGGLDSLPEPYSIFAPTMCGFWCAARNIGLHDLLGAASGAVGVRVGSGGTASAAPEVIVGAALVVSATESISAALPY